AMFAIEAMASGKPVLCNVRQDLVELYQFAGLLKDGEIPLIHSDYKNVKANLAKLYENPQLITSLGKSGREYVVKHHSIESVGKSFDLINKKINLKPLEKS